MRFIFSSNSSSPIDRAIGPIARSQPIVDTHQQKYSSTHLVQTRIWAMVGVGRAQPGRVRKGVFEIFTDHGRFRDDPSVMIESGHLAARIDPS